MKLLSTTIAAMFVLSLAGVPSVAQQKKKTGKSCQEFCKMRTGGHGIKHAECMSRCASKPAK